MLVQHISDRNSLTIMMEDECTWQLLLTAGMQYKVLSHITQWVVSVLLIKKIVKLKGMLETMFVRLVWTSDSPQQNWILSKKYFVESSLTINRLVEIHPDGCTVLSRSQTSIQPRRAVFQGCLTYIYIYEVLFHKRLGQLRRCQRCVCDRCMNVCVNGWLVNGGVERRYIDVQLIH